MHNDIVSILHYVTILSDNTDLFFKRSFVKQNLSPGRQIALLKIYENPGLTMSQLGELTHYPKSPISKIVNELVEEAYITLEVDQKDRRIKHLYPTKKAEQQVFDILKLRDWWLDKLFDGYDNTKREELFKIMIDLAKRSSELLEGEKGNVKKR